MISSYVGDNKLFEQQYLSGELELELSGHAGQARARGRMPAFYTATGVGTRSSRSRSRNFSTGRSYVRETWLRADLSIVKAWRADPEGNLVYRKTARNRIL
ncbi:CoA-transferase [Sphingomonas sp. MMS24-JH45]